jgi:predicted transcriptional regulator
MNTRCVVFNSIEQNPCLHFRALLKLTDLAVGQLQHHVYKLVRNDEVASFKLFGNTRYCSISVSPQDRILLGVLRLPRCRQIIAHLLEHEGTHCRDLCARIELTPPTLSWYTARLASIGVIVKKKHGCKQCLHLRQPERVKALIDVHRESFLEESVHGFMDAWASR